MFPGTFNHLILSMYSYYQEPLQERNAVYFAQICRQVQDHLQSDRLGHEQETVAVCVGLLSERQCGRLWGG